MKLKTHSDRILYIAILVIQISALYGLATIFTPDKALAVTTLGWIVLAGAQLSICLLLRED